MRHNLVTYVVVLVLAACNGRTILQASPPTKDRVKVAGLVVRWVRGDKAANFQRIEPMIRQAAAKGAKIVVTTECFLDGYAIADRSIPLDDYMALGEPIPSGEYFQKLAKLAAELKIILVAGMTEADGEKRYNTVVIIGPDGKLIGKYRKQELGHELGRNTPGKLSPVFPTPYGNMGVVICADRRYPKLVKKICSNGADFLICPSGGMFGPKRNDHFLQARSKENGIYIVFVHPVEFLVTKPDGGVERRVITGDSLLIDPAKTGSKEDKKSIYYFELPVAKAVTAGKLKPQDKESAAILKLVQDSQLAGFEKHIFKKYIEPWAEDAKLIIGRTAKADKYDVVLNLKQIKATRKLRFKDPPSEGAKMTFENGRVKIDGNKAIVTYRTTLQTKVDKSIVKETVDEVFHLRRTKYGWKIYENRGWMVKMQTGDLVIHYNAAKWKELDANVEKQRMTGAPAKLVEALSQAFRFNEAYQVAKQWSKKAPDESKAWFWRGTMALLVGEAEDSIASKRKSLP